MPLFVCAHQVCDVSQPFEAALVLLYSLGDNL